jgi:beta-carotene hydroxylase
MDNSVTNKYSKKFCLPLLVEWFIAVLFYFGAITMSIGGSISLVVGSIIVCLSYFSLFNSMHSSAHRHFSGGLNKHRWVDKTIGQISGLLIQIPFKPFRKIHLEHHNNTNIKGIDPDYTQHKKFSEINKYVFLSYLIQVAISFPFLGQRFLKRLPAPIQKRLKNRRHKSITMQIRATYAILIVSVFLGYGAYAFWLLLFPYLVQRYYLAIAFMWMPHISGDSSRYGNTRNLVTPLINGISFMKLVDFHTEHHLYPSIPSSYLRKLHFEIIDELDENKVIYIGRFNKKPWKKQSV